MLARDAHIKKIASILAHLESYLSLLSPQNLNDAAVLFEDACIPLLDCVFALSLKNANAEFANFPAADLIARDARHGFQITINDTTEKIRDTHRKATAHGMAAHVDLLTIFFVVRAAPAEPEVNKKFTRCTAPKIDTLDLKGLLSIIQRFETTRIVEIAAILERDIDPAIPKAAPKPNNLPAAIGHLFVGRDAFLADLRTAIAKGGSAGNTLPVVVQGMGGVGKTRTAIEYAWQHAAAYDALLFITADSPETLQRDLAALCGANVLDLPESAATDLPAQAAAAIAWLRAHPGWLLLIDNVDTPEAQRAVTALAGQIPGGHLIITTRIAQWNRNFTPLELRVLDEENSITFLKTHTDDTRTLAADDEASVREIARDLDGLCLALDQAAAWICTNTATFARYLAEWRSQSTRIHREYLELGIADYHTAHPDIPRALFVTYETSLRQLTEDARHLFRILAWLAPEPIPTTLLEQLTTIPQAAKVLLELTKMSLATRTRDGTSASIHRMLQRIGREQQTEEKPPALQEALDWLNKVMPYKTDDVRTWPVAGPLIPHAEAAAMLAADRGIAEPTGRLLNEVGVYFQARADYGGAERNMLHALAIFEDSLGKKHPNVGTALNNLSELLRATNRLAEAEPLYRRALAIWEDSLGEKHPYVGNALNNLAILLQATNRLAEAEPLYRRALAIWEDSLGKKHPNVCTALHNLASLLQATNRLAEAEPLMRCALAIDEASYGDRHPDVARDLNNLAQLLKATNRLAEAEPLMRRVVSIFEASLGDNHPNVATALNNLAQLLQATNRLAEAEPLMRRALTIDEASYGDKHPDVAIDLSNLAALLRDTNRLAEAEPLTSRAYEILEQSLGVEHPNTQLVGGNLERLRKELGAV